MINPDDLMNKFSGELFTDKTTRSLYATDASAYRQLPLAVAIPRTDNDIKALVNYANQNKLSLIPRTAGTSLAGQVVGGGIIVDVSKHFNKILEVNVEEKWVRVRPGVVRDELNLYLKQYDLYFGPETSTSNRAMVGGMVGNNSCGSNSLVYDSTRDHLISLRVILSDGSEAEFGPVDQKSFSDKINLNNLEGEIYRKCYDLLSNMDHRKEITAHYPKKSITRRNTGYALDLLMDAEPFGSSPMPFNFCKLLAGSEGTLAFTTEIKLGLSPLPLPHRRLICAHFDSIQEALRANLVALTYHPEASELIDQYIIQSARSNIEQRRNSFFIEGNPAAILVIELARNSDEEVIRDTENLVNDLKANKMGFHFPVVKSEDAGKVWNLRKAGLGLLANIPGDEKPIPVVEDTAVDVEDLPAYIEEFNQILDKYGLHSVHYAHAGSGELHLRPIINLKSYEGNHLFRTILSDVAGLVKKYGGSLSGEHGDGRLRGEFIRFMIGDKNYELLRQVKEIWDPNHIFNPNKIVDTPPMNESLRYAPGQVTPVYATVFDFSGNGGIVRAAEQCNGSGDCRKTALIGGTMCPSYMATRNEKDTTRARANILREVLGSPNQKQPFNSPEALEILELCISCKGCKSECPSNVDMARLKTEFLHQYYQYHPRPRRDWLFAHIHKLNRFANVVPVFFNTFVSNKITSIILKSSMGMSLQRSIPIIARQSVRSWYKKNRINLEVKALAAGNKGKVYFFCDEFTNEGKSDAEAGIKAMKLLAALGYHVEVPKHDISGRALLSKGFLTKARKAAIRNIHQLKGIINKTSPLVGLEPSAILTFRDEYPDLAGNDLKKTAQNISANVFLLDEFLASEVKKGNVSADQFDKKDRQIALHAHCHQKALSSVSSTIEILSLPAGNRVSVIPSGCCGMAGSFGYEKEHFDISMQIGELVLFPAIRKLSTDTIIAANGTSCRHQILDGVDRKGFHPVEILFDALKEEYKW